MIQRLLESLNQIIRIYMFDHQSNNNFNSDAIYINNIINPY